MMSINIEKRHLYLLSAVMVFLVGVGLVVGGVGQGTSHDPGHDLDTITGHKTGELDLGNSLDNIDSRITLLETKDLNCRKVSSLNDPVYFNAPWWQNDVECSPDTSEIAIGGGCYSEDDPAYPLTMGLSRPGTKDDLSAQGWYCVASNWYAGTLKAYVICCRESATKDYFH